MAQRRVRRSPGPMLEKRRAHWVLGGVVRRSRPAKARSAPRAAFQPGGRVPGGRSAGKAVKSGDEDHDEAGNEGAFGGGGASEAGGLELVSGGEEGADDEAGEDGAAVEVAQAAVVDES